MKKNPALSLLAALGVGAAIAFGTPGASLARAETEKAKSSNDAAAKPAKDVLILKSGKTVEGKILEETATTIRFEVRIGTIASPTTYEKSEILEIKRGVASNPAEGDAKAAETNATNTEAPPADKKKDKDQNSTRAPTGDENAKTIYFVEFKGAMARDLTPTPLTKLFEDVEKHDPDVVVIKMDTVATPFGPDNANTIFAAEKSGPPIERAIVEKKRRVVFWIDKALGGSALLPFVSQEIYFTSEGWMGDMNDLDTFSSGDKMVDEKLISARMGHMRGFLIKGGYEPKFIEAMVRKQYWLSVKMEGGKPTYMDRQPTQAELADGWLILTDDGKDTRKDKTQVGGRGNDQLSFDARWAEALGVSDGTVDTLDELADKLGIGTNYRVLKDTKGKKILKDWSDGVDDVITKLYRNGNLPGTLERELSEIPESGSSPEETLKNMGKRMQLLRAKRGLFAAYAEVFDDDGGQRAQLDVQIEVLKQQIAAANKAAQDQAAQNRNSRGR
jgi:hypothetical protein